MRDDETERETSRTRDICGDNGPRTVIFTYLLVKRERQVAVAAPDLYYNHSEVCRAVDWRDGGSELSLQYTAQSPQPLLDTGEHPLYTGRL